MSEIYTKEIITKKISSFIKCDVCGREICLDYWDDFPKTYKIDNKDYCINCKIKYNKKIF